MGLVASLARPDGNMTGITLITSEIAAAEKTLPTECDISATTAGVV
jgi:hypothetical protein